MIIQVSISKLLKDIYLDWKQSDKTDYKELIDKSVGALKEMESKRDE